MSSKPLFNDRRKPTYWWLSVCCVLSPSDTCWCLVHVKVNKVSMNKRLNQKNRPLALRAFVKKNKYVTEYVWRSVVLGGCMLQTGDELRWLWFAGCVGLLVCLFTWLPHLAAAAPAVFSGANLGQHQWVIFSTNPSHTGDKSLRRSARVLNLKIPRFTRAWDRPETCFEFIKRIKH